MQEAVDAAEGARAEWGILSIEERAAWLDKIADCKATMFHPTHIIFLKKNEIFLIEKASQCIFPRSLTPHPPTCCHAPFTCRP